MLRKSELPLQGFKREKMQNTPQIPLCARQSCGGESAAACQGQHGTVPPSGTPSPWSLEIHSFPHWRQGFFESISRDNIGFIRKSWIPLELPKALAVSSPQPCPR